MLHRCGYLAPLPKADTSAGAVHIKFLQLLLHRAGLKCVFTDLTACRMCRRQRLKSLHEGLSCLKERVRKMISCCVLISERDKCSQIRGRKLNVVHLTIKGRQKRRKEKRRGEGKGEDVGERKRKRRNKKS